MAASAMRGILTHMKKQMRNKMIIGSALLMLAAKPARGADDASSDSFDLYPARQLSVDAFGTVSEGKYTIEHVSEQRVRNNARGGVGAGITYFITRNIGVGADAYSESTSGPFIDNASGNFVKVTQRIPVKIVLNAASDGQHPLRPGMSVDADVDISN